MMSGNRPVVRRLRLVPEVGAGLEARAQVFLVLSVLEENFVLLLEPVVHYLRHKVQGSGSGWVGCEGDAHAVDAQDVDVVTELPRDNRTSRLPTIPNP